MPRLLLLRVLRLPLLLLLLLLSVVSFSSDAIPLPTHGAALLVGQSNAGRLLHPVLV